MRILMISRSTLFSNPGGDTVQILNTAKSLKKLGVKIDVNVGAQKIDYQGYDLLHFFNIIRPADILGHLKKSNLPYVVSPIFVDYSEYENKARTGFAGAIAKILNADQQEYAKAIVRSLLNGEKIADLSYLLKGHYNSVRSIIKGAAMLLPNSKNEHKRLFAAYGIKKDYRVIPNAIDETIFISRGAEKDEKFVLCVARIEGIKNQLNLIRALNGTDFRLLIVGNYASNHKSYYEQCKREAQSNIEFLPAMNQEELVDLYAKAKVHVLPSWFETTGLSSLEAASMGCNIVISNRGDAFEYFEEDAFYCDPEDILSIRKEIINAASFSSNKKLEEKIFSTYTWSHTAKETKMAYEIAMKEKSLLLIAGQ